MFQIGTDLFVGSEEPKCMNCRFCGVYTDEDLCMRLVCRGTRSKKGRTITWTMLCCGENLFQYFADHVEKHARPKWCPRKKGAGNEKD